MIDLRFALAVLAFAWAAPANASAPVDGPTAVVERFLDDYAAERLTSITDYLAQDAEMRIPFSPGGATVLKGPQAIAYLQSVFAQYASIALSDVTITPAADGRTVFVEALVTYTDHKGASHSIGSIWSIEVVDGRIVRSRTYALPA